MTVRPLRDGRYVVETAGGTYVVDVERETCTCPDSAIRGVRCKHRRRVALEIEAGLVPGPNERERVCAVCGGRAFVPDDGDERSREDPADHPALCERHERAPGELVRDRETGSLLVVADALGTRADATQTTEGRLVSSYESNAAYGGHEPVFAVVYVDSLPVDDVSDSRRYLFPASRLRSVTSDRDNAGNARRNANGSESAARDRGTHTLLGVVADVGEA
ncbi:SWIM zinc finger family protein [Halobellus captivus]|uniref:SWIM zinc finger family protein n=1 Tax=Halobellus captivus TaxID=2592614 RepID=UPI001939C888|nr:SWIM zinc finger family protein [Halobellus captivus]